MPLLKDVKKVLVIGSGPIIIGQAAEFDYAGTQACLSLKEEGLQVVLVNSNPATIMTDTNIADSVYIEPLTIETIKKVVEIEKPDSILATLGGQTGLNLSMELWEEGYLQSHNIKMLGTAVRAIKMAEDRLEFKEAMERINEPCIDSVIANTIDEAVDFGEKSGYPLIVRPAYTMGGTGGGIANNVSELKEIASHGLRLSRVSQCLIEKCISGWKEIEYEVIRDAKGNCITVCNMENVDPVGVHTGDSIVVAPTQTLSHKECGMLRDAAFNIITELGIEGGCNVQFALNPLSFEYAVIEVNPRVSRSSALASKATGYPIAKVASKIAIGYSLNEIPNAITGKTFACFEPTIDYVVAKLPRLPFDKFISANKTLGTQMKATGEVMAIASSFEAAMMKAVRSLEQHVTSFSLDEHRELTDAKIKEMLSLIDDKRIFVVTEAIRRGIDLLHIHTVTKIDMWFLYSLEKIVNMENRLKEEEMTEELMRDAKKMGFSDQTIGEFVDKKECEVREIRKSYKILPSYKRVDTCGAEFEALTPYYYSDYMDDNESIDKTDKKKVIVLGSGPIRIGQGIEFDYCSVHSVWALKQAGYEAIIINNNPETVSTDFDISDRLYFEPLTEEDVENIIELEKPFGAIVQFGGQTAIKLTKKLNDLGVKILGTKADDVDAAEDREKFDEILTKCDIPRPAGHTVFTLDEALKAANELTYPVMVRPSYVLGGQGMEIAYNDYDVAEFMAIVNKIKQEHPILIDKYMQGQEVEVDAICDGTDILIPGIMEHLERAGVHSGDSISVYPTQTVAQKHKDTIVEYTKSLASALNVLGLINIQFIICDDNVYVIEVNPRSSRTVPYISKITNIPMVDLATECMLGRKLKDFEYGTGIYAETEYVAVKMPIFSFEKLHDVDISLGPEMKSTGEVLGVAKTFEEALYKAFLGAGVKIAKSGKLIATVRDKDKDELVDIIRDFAKLGFKIYATGNTQKHLVANNIEAELVDKLEEGKNNIVNLVNSGNIDLIINTPTRGREPERDGFRIRRSAVEHSIPCVTSLDTAKAMITAISVCDHKNYTVLDMKNI